MKFIDDYVEELNKFMASRDISELSQMDVEESLENLEQNLDHVEAEGMVNRFKEALASYTEETIPNRNKDFPNMVCDETKDIGKFIDIINEELELEIPKDKVLNAFDITKFYAFSKYDTQYGEREGIIEPIVYLVLMKDLDVSKDLGGTKSFHFEHENIILRFEGYKNE